jgi:hypothetical protein
LADFEFIYLSPAIARASHHVNHMGGGVEGRNEKALKFELQRLLHAQM